MSQRRVAVTGLGAVSGLGANVAANWAAVLEGRGAIAPHVFDAGPNAPPPVTLPAAMAQPGFDAALVERLGGKIAGALDRFALFALCAAFEAVNHAGLLQDPVLDQRTAIVLGHGNGGQETLETGFDRFYGQKVYRVHPASVPRLMVSAAVSAVAMSFGVHGPVFATSSACASSAHAIWQGAMLIRSDMADVAIVGGSEAVATPGSMAGWQAVRALAETTCRPFSRGRDGMVMGEGGAALILEDWEHATARGAPILGEYLGAGMSSDAFHITQPSRVGVVAALRGAVAAGGLAEAAEILISTHGTGTPLNDENEAGALNEVFAGSRARRPVIATKSAHGHLIGGSAALQAVIALKALAEGRAPPILNMLEPDPACDLDLVLGQARPIAATHALVNAFAFGGLNVALAFARA